VILFQPAAKPRPFLAFCSERFKNDKRPFIKVFVWYNVQLLENFYGVFQRKLCIMVMVIVVVAVFSNHVCWSVVIVINNDKIITYFFK